MFIEFKDSTIRLELIPMETNQPPLSIILIIVMIIWILRRYSTGPRTRRPKTKDKKSKEAKASLDEKRPRTAFTNEQLEKLRQEFQANT